MTDHTLDSSAVDWVIDHPETRPVFESLGLDCSCAGKSVEYLCLQQALDPDDVLRRLTAAMARANPERLEPEPPRRTT